ncbi:hypothetical protein [Streptomyces sp. NPDC001530]
MRGAHAVRHAARLHPQTAPAPPRPSPHSTRAVLP